MPEKPDKKMFHAGLKWTGVKTYEALFLDDNAVCVRAAMKAGLPSFHVEWKDIPEDLLMRKH
jgi:HAD superfamily hydrolase (TIGR01509 family)